MSTRRMLRGWDLRETVNANDAILSELLDPEPPPKLGTIWAPANTVHEKVCLSAVLLFCFGAMLLYADLAGGDVSRFPTRRSRWLLRISSGLTFVGAIFFGAPGYEIVNNVLVLDRGWSGFLLVFFAQLCLISALMPTRHRLLIRSRPWWLQTLAYLVIATAFLFALFAFRLLYGIIDFQIAFHDVLYNVRRPPPTEYDPIVSLEAHRSWRTPAANALSAYGCLVIVFTEAYCWCYRCATSARVFISYRRSESSHIVGRLFDRLVGRYGTGTVYKDTDSIPISADVRTHIRSAVRQCQLVLVVIGVDWLAPNAQGRLRLYDPEDYVRMEIEEAFAANTIVVPVVTANATWLPEQKVPESIAKILELNAIPLRDDPDFDGDVDQLVNAIESSIVSRSGIHKVGTSIAGRPPHTT